MGLETRRALPSLSPTASIPLLGLGMSIGFRSVQVRPSSLESATQIFPMRAVDRTNILSLFPESGTMAGWMAPQGSPGKVMGPCFVQFLPPLVLRSTQEAQA